MVNKKINKNFVIVQCRSCHNKNIPSSNMMVCIFEDRTELYCGVCGVPIQTTNNKIPFEFENLLKHIEEKQNGNRS